MDGQAYGPAPTRSRTTHPSLEDAREIIDGVESSEKLAMVARERGMDIKIGMAEPYVGEGSKLTPADSKEPDAG